MTARTNDASGIQRQHVRFSGCGLAFWGLVALGLLPIRAARAQTPTRFDFGTSGSPVAAGYTRVTARTSYNASFGYGWRNSGLYDFDRGIGSTLERDFVYGIIGRFSVNVANGTYDVAVTLGDVGIYPHDNVGVTLEGLLVDQVSTVAGQVVTNTYKVVVSDGILDLVVQNLGGTNPHFVIEGLTITKTAAITGGPRVTGASPQGNVVGPVDRILLTFDRPIDPSTFTPAEVLSLENPVWEPIPVTAVNPLSLTQFEILFAPQTMRGYYELRLSEKIADLFGNPIDQNQSGSGGHAPSDQFTLCFMIASPMLFDFGTDASPVAAGYTQVTPDTMYTDATGYGWVSDSLTATDRGGLNALEGDFNAGTESTFAVALADGVYYVTLTIGDLGAVAHETMEVYLEGTLVDTVSTAAGEVVTKVYQATVLDGALTVKLKDAGGADPNFVINGLAIADTGTIPVGTHVVDVTPTGVVPGPVSSLVFTFSNPLAPGSFTPADVVSFKSPSSAAIPITGVTMLAPTSYMVSFPAQSAAGSYTMILSETIADFAGDPLDQDLDGVPGEAIADRVVASFILAPALLRFDFGTATSPLAAGYTRITATTGYNVLTKYGWRFDPQFGSLAHFDRGIGTALTRDFVYGRKGWFAAAVPNGTYLVTVTMGDLGVYPHDSQGVYLEGILVGQVSTVPGEVVSNTYRVTVADGELTVIFVDLGGADPNFVVEALTVAVAAPGTAPLFVADSAPTGLVAGPVDRVSLTFSKQVDPTSFTTSQVVSLQGPEDTNIPVTAVNRINATLYEVVFPPQSTPGVYKMVLSNAIRDTSGSWIDQDRDTVQGEFPDDQFTTFFAIGTPTLFDFGTATSPVAAGYTRVARDTTFSETTEYGWRSGAIRDGDRPAGTALTRDFSYASAGVFGAFVPNGVYDVTLTMGDTGIYAHDEVQVFLQDALRDVVSTAAGVVVTNTYRVGVTGEYLGLSLDDLGGVDPNFVLNGLAIVPVDVLDLGLPRRPIVPQFGCPFEQPYIWTAADTAPAPFQVTLKAVGVREDSVPEWEFDDGTLGVELGLEVTHTFVNPGLFTVTMTVNGQVRQTMIMVTP